MGNQGIRVLAIESSTSSAKALLYDTEKGIIRSNSCTYKEAVQAIGLTDTEKVYALTMEMARKTVQGEEIEAIAICGIWHGLTVCDDQFKPISPHMAWNFTGTGPICKEIRQDEERTNWLYQRTGCMPHVTYPRHALTYLQNQGVSLKDTKIMTQGGFNFYRLTGEWLETPCILSGCGVINLEKVDYDDEVLSYLGVSRGQFAPLVSYKETRPLSENAAKLLGVRAGIPVVPAHADGALNQVGSCANNGGEMTLSVGTSGAMRMASGQPKMPEGRQLWCYYGVDKWISGAATAGACNCINWYKKTLLQDTCSFQDLEKGATQKEDLPVFLPFLFGERCPGWRDDRRGGFYDINGDHTSADLYQAMQMGILFNLYQNFRVLCQLNGKPEAIVVSGGISNSDKWLQMAADIFKQDILAAECPDASTMGAAALALHSAGALQDVNSFSAGRESERRFTPNEDAFAYYEKQFGRYLEEYEKQ